MNVVSIFSSAFCREDEFIEKLFDGTGYERLNDETIVKRAEGLSSLPADMLRRAFSSKPSVSIPSPGSGSDPSRG
jgi:hypothetical protein